MFVYPDMRVRFEGHACTIGPEGVNKRLSERRAKAFHSGFLEYLRNEHPEDFDTFSARMDQAVGYGESLPLQIKKTNGEVILIGKNNSPI